MSYTEHNAKTPSIRAAVLATLRARLRGSDGTGAPPSRPASGARTPSSRRPKALLATALTCALAAVIAASASAATPTVTIKPAASVGFTTAKAEGTVNPAGHETFYHFDYITDAAFQAKDEQQKLTVSATAGTYTLSFGAQSTAAIAFNAAAAEVKAALNALSTIGGAGGSVAVSGGPGDEAGSAPYTITFGTSLGATDVEQISSDASALSGGSQSANPETTVEGRAAGFQGANQVGFGTLPEGASETAVEVNPLEGLAPNTTYHLRLFAENTEAQHAEAIASTFTTKATTPPVLAVKAPEASYLKAQLAATINPEGGNVNPIGGPIPIAWQLQFSAVSEPGNWQLAEAGEIKEAQAEANTAIEVTGEATGLHPSTPYITRLVVNYAGIETIAAEEPGFATLAVAKPTVTIEPIATFTAHTAHFVGHINPNAPNAEGSTSPAEEEAFKTHYRFQCEPECPGLEGEVLADKNPHEVSAEATGLIPGHPYSVVLVAENAGGIEETAPVLFTTEALPPAIDATFATEVGETEATLGAKVNPGGASTTVHFEYVTLEQFEQPGPEGGFAKATSTTESGSIGSNDEDQPASAEIEGLEPNTAYRYRVVATNAKSPAGLPGPTKGFHTTSPAQSFGGECPANEQIRREDNSTALPDCRAYEQVSPVDKGGTDAYEIHNRTPVQASPDGQRISYQASQGFPGADGNTALFSDHFSARQATGWQTRDLTPPKLNVEPLLAYLVGYDFSEDLTHEVVKVPNQPLAPGATPQVYNLFQRSPGGPYSLVNNAQPALTPAEQCPGALASICHLFADLLAYAGASTDFSHVLFESNAQLTPQAPEAGIESLYESSGGQVKLVGFLPDGQPAAAGATAGAGSSVEYGSYEPTADHRVEHAISANGSRVIFSAQSDEGVKPAEAGQAGLTEVYDRIAGKETVELSAPNAGATPENPAAAPATFWAASADGSRVFFTSAAELTTGANTGAANNGEALYEYDFATESLADLSPDANPAEQASGPRVLGVLGASEDGSYVYFVAAGQLQPGVGEANQPNLYMTHDGGAPLFIATLSGSDSDDWTPIPAQLHSYLTADGRHLAFMSLNSLTGYDNTDQTTGEPDQEVFEYSAPTAAEEAAEEDGGLLCASCDPSGRSPTASAFLGGVQRHLDGSLGTLGTPFHQVRALSVDGSRLFFNSPPIAAENATVAAQAPAKKVYEFQLPGQGCADASGCAYLLSNPASGSEDVFLDASANGDAVFFATHARLLSTDQDGLIDVYDAREKGGFPAPPAPPPCEGEGCRGPASISTPGSAKATATFAGPEEGPKHPRCARGRVRRHGRCVVRKHPKKKAHRKHRRAANANRRTSR